MRASGEKKGPWHQQKPRLGPWALSGGFVRAAPNQPAAGEDLSRSASHVGLPIADGARREERLTWYRMDMTGRRGVGNPRPGMKKECRGRRGGPCQAESVERIDTKRYIKSYVQPKRNWNINRMTKYDEEEERTRRPTAPSTRATRDEPASTGPLANPPPSSAPAHSSLTHASLQSGPRKP